MAAWGATSLCALIFMSNQGAGDRIDENLQIDKLRDAIRANRVSFPVPVPVFVCQYRADIQWRLAELYLVHGWLPARLAQRYNISCTRVRQSVRGWVRRARTLGYLQTVPPETESATLAVRASSHLAHLQPGGGTAAGAHLS